MTSKEWVKNRDARNREVKSLRAALGEAIFEIERLTIVNEELRAHLAQALRTLGVFGFVMKGADILPFDKCLGPRLAKPEELA